MEYLTDLNILKEETLGVAVTQKSNMPFLEKEKNIVLALQIVLLFIFFNSALQSVIVEVTK